MLSIELGRSDASTTDLLISCHCMYRTHHASNAFDHLTAPHAISSLDAAVRTLQSGMDAFASAEREARQAAEALSQIQSRLAKRMSNIVQTRCSVKMARGLSLLPDDVLALIFETTASSDHPFPSGSCWKTPFRLACVCRRFRGVAVQTPSIWSYVATGMNSDALDACLRNSRNRPLSVNLLSVKGNDWNEFFKTVTPHSPRWVRLAIRYTPIMAASMQELASAFEGLSGLRTLVVERLHQFQPFLRPRINEMLNNLFIHTSSLTLCTMTVIRMGGHLPSLPSTLTHLDLNMQDMPTDIDKFLTVFSRLHVLEYLVLELCWNEENPFPARRSLPVVEMLSVRTLKLRIDNRIAKLVHGLAFPNVVSTLR